MTTRTIALRRLDGYGPERMLADDPQLDLFETGSSCRDLGRRPVVVRECT
jgi:hypothetical protein